MPYDNSKAALGIIVGLISWGVIIVGLAQKMLIDHAQGADGLTLCLRAVLCLILFRCAV